MNEVFLDAYYGREHVQELIKEAEQERLAQKLVQTRKSTRPLTQVRGLLLKAVSVIVS